MRKRPFFVLALLIAGALGAQAQMDLAQVSGQPLPSPDLPAGTVTVRVVRGALTNNLVEQPVELTIDGATRQLTTDDGGRVEVSGLARGARVQAVTVVDGERVESVPFTIGETGIRMMLVAGLREGGSPAPGSGPAASGGVAFGPESRVVVEMADDRLNAYFLFEVVNPGPTAADIGGPLTIELPREARGAVALQDSTPQATVVGTHVIVTGPFAPGRTPVRVGFELPSSRGTAELEARIPAVLPQVIVIVSQLGGLQLVSPQITATREVTDRGQRILVGTGPGLQAGQTLQFEITGLPYHPVWPQYLALGLAGAIMTAGVWAAATARPRRKRE
jgi:hypothetical protein